MPRRHDPDECTICTELPHLAGYRYPMWLVAQRIGARPEMIDRHVRARPELARLVHPDLLSELRALANVERKTRQARPRQVAV